MGVSWIKRAVWALLVAAGLAGIGWFAWPRPILVDLATVTRGSMEVTVDDDGKTEVRHVYTEPSAVFQSGYIGGCTTSARRWEIRVFSQRGDESTA